MLGWTFTEGSLPAGPGGCPEPGVRAGSETKRVNDRGFPQDGLPKLTAVPAARSRAAVLKVRLYLVLGGLVVTSLIGVFAAVAFLTFDPPVVDVAESKPRGRAVAELSAHDYLFGGALLLPTAPNQEIREGSSVEVFGPLTWDGFERITLASGVPAEMHTFLFHRPVRSGGTTDETGALVGQQVSYQLMKLTVLVAVPADGNPVLAARPHFVPAEYREVPVVADYTDLDPQPLPATALEQLRSWATAWATDDAEKLKLLTGDQTPNVRYVGLGGYEFTGMSVIASIPVAEDAFVVRARLVLAGANGSTLEMDMDLTITAASTGLPNVSGWGPAGSGLTTPADVRVGTG